jgi:hypothetical protein
MIKYIVICSFLISFAIPSYAEQSVGDEENSSIDSQVGKVVNDEPGLSSVNAAGIYTPRVCSFSPGSNLTDCSCESNEIVISGGAYGPWGVTFRESRWESAKTWRVACISTDSGLPADCQEIFILCLQL